MPTSVAWGESSSHRACSGAALSSQRASALNCGPLKAWNRHLPCPQTQQCKAKRLGRHVMIGSVTWRSRQKLLLFKTKISDLTSLSTDINRPPVSVSGVQAYWRTPHRGSLRIFYLSQKITKLTKVVSQTHVCSQLSHPVRCAWAMKLGLKPTRSCRSSN